MNQLEIKERAEQLIKQADEDIEILFSNMLKNILSEIDQLYKKYGDGTSDPSFTDLNKYNRLNNALNRIAVMMGAEYQEISTLIQKMQQNVYLQTYMMQAYLTEQFSQTDLGIQLPSTQVILTALANPIELLTIPKIMQNHRDQVIRQVRISVTQGLVNGSGYYQIAEELEKHLGFNSNKARTVARTEGARAMSIADEDMYQKVMNSESSTKDGGKYAPRLTKVWLSSLDNDVRNSHRKLDGQKADKDGLFHYGGATSPGPVLWGIANMDINCRCSTFMLVNGMYPSVRRGRDYRDVDYQKRLVARIDKYMEDGKTYAQSFKLADKEVRPPSREFPYITYEDWYKENS